MGYRVFLRVATCWLLSLTYMAAWAAEDGFENPAALQAGAAQFLTEQLTGRFGAQKFASDIELKLMPLDARLRLARCSNPLAYSLNSSNLDAGQTSIKVACTSSTPWSLMIPAQITRYGLVAVAKRSLARGDWLQPSDIEFTRQNLGQIGPNYVDNIERLMGLELKRPLREGETLRMSYVAAPKIVRTGDQVALEALAGGLQVVAQGVAMGNGQLGEAVRVKNASSQRIVDAVVVAPGRVQTR